MIWCKIRDVELAIEGWEEVDTRPTEQYSDIGGLDKQIQELIEAVVVPMTHKER